MKKSIFIVILFLCGLVISIPLGKYSPSPVGGEFRHGIDQYLAGNGVIIKSLNTQLDTVYFYGLHSSNIRGKDGTYNPRFTGSIILFSIYGGISGDREGLNILLLLLMLGIGVSIFLILKKDDWISNQSRSLFVLLGCGLPFYVFYGGKLDDPQISYFLFFCGHYLSLSHWKRKSYLGHFFMAVAGGFYRTEFIILYALHWIFFGIRKPLVYLFFLLFSIALLSGMNYFYRDDYRTIRYQYQYLREMNTGEIERAIFDNEQQYFFNRFDDYYLQEFSKSIDESIISKKDSIGLRGTLLASTHGLKIHERWTHIRNLFLYSGNISFFVVIGSVILFNRVNFISHKKTYRFIGLLLCYVVLIYYRFLGMADPSNPLFINSSHVRYALGVWCLFWSLGILSLIRWKRKILTIIILFASFLAPLKFLSFTSSGHYATFNSFRTIASSYEKNVKHGYSEVVWIVAGNVKRVIFEDNPNVMTLKDFDEKTMFFELEKIIRNAEKNNYLIIYSGSPSATPYPMRQILSIYFLPPVSINRFQFYNTNFPATK